MVIIMFIPPNLTFPTHSMQLSPIIDNTKNHPTYLAYTSPHTNKNYTLLAKKIIIALLLTSFTSHADVLIDGGQVMTIPGSESSPFTAGTLMVGSLSTGELHITNEGIVLSQATYIGSSNGSAGYVTVDGLGSQLNNTGVLYVGNWGDGTLEITNGGQVSSTASTYVGGQTTSTGLATVSGAGSQWNLNSLSVGLAGNGTLNITDGGSVSNSAGIIGNTLTSTGIVTVNGSGSQWVNSSQLTIGDNGNGTLEIFDGGQVSNANGTIAANGGSIGSVTVNGAGSQWINSGLLTIGDSGDGTLEISDGGLVSSSSLAGIGTLAINNGTLTLSNGGLFSGIISGTHGDLTLSGGTLTLTGTNTYTGDTTIDNNAILHIGSGATSGSYAGDIANSGALIFNRSDQSTYSGVISGLGTLTKNGTGLLTLNGVSTYTGETTIQAGTLQLGINDALGGTTQLNILSGATADINGMTQTVGSLAGAGALGINSGMLTISGGGSFSGIVSSTSGDLTLSGGVLTLTGNNTYTGNTTINSGATLQLGDGGTTGSYSGNIVDNGALIFDRSDSLAYTGIISGSGALTQAGAATLTLSGTNTYIGDTNISSGTLQLTGAGAIHSASSMDIANNATLSIYQTTDNNGHYTFANALTGNGLLTVDLLTDTKAFSFSPTTGSHFAGTVLLNTSLFSLSGSNTTALSHAMLVAGSGNQTTIGPGSQMIGGLGFDGGTAIFDLTIPSATEANGNIKIADTLDATGTGTIQISVPPSFSAAPPSLSSELSIFEQDSSNILAQLVDATGATVIGDGGNLSLVDQNGNVLSDNQRIDLTNMTGGPVVAEGHYDYRLTTGPDGDGLYVNYGLTQVDLIGTGSDALVLSPRAGATGSAADLSARLTGSGDLTIATVGGSLVSLSNSANDYTGTTYIQSGTLLFGNHNILGQTDNLQLDTGTLVNMAGYNQSVGALNTASGSEISVSGTLTITDSQRALGDINGGSLESSTLFGNGSLVIDPSTLYVNETQAGYTGRIILTGGSHLLLNAAQAFNNAQEIVLTSASDILSFADLSAQNPAWNSTANGTMQVSLSGLGTVQVQDGSAIALSGNNSHFTGLFDITAGSVLSASQAKNLGTASIQNQGQLIVTANSDWAFSSSLTGSGTFVKAGTETLDVGRFLSGFSGQTQINAGILQFGSPVQAGSIGGSVDIGSGATLKGMGTIEGDISSQGTIDIGLGDILGSMAIAGNYTATDGIVQLKTQLGDDNALSDKLAITGNAEGNTRVKVTNLGGLGAQTINGINIIEVGGVAEDDTFLLAGDYVTDDGQQAVIGGAYAYTLHANGNAADAGRNWYLSSQLAETKPEAGQRYQPGVPLYEQYPQVLAALNTLPTLQQRVGNRYWSKNAVQDTNSLDENQWGWGRIEGSHQSVDPARSTSGSQRKIDLWKLQTGVDVPLYQSNDGSLLTGGVNFSYGKASADVSSYFGHGSINTSGYGLGASLTWYGHSGIYVDGQLQTMWFDSDIQSDTVGQGLKSGNNGRGYTSSIESGKRYSLSDELSLTPQIQLTYSRVNFDTFNDPFDSKVSLESGDNLLGRIGVSLNKEIITTTKHGVSSQSNVYGNVDLYNEFLNGSKVSVSGGAPAVDFSSRDERQYVGVGTGATHEWLNGRYAVYGNINLLTATHNMGDNYAVGGSVGVRLSW